MFKLNEKKLSFARNIYGLLTAIGVLAIGVLSRIFGDTNAIILFVRNYYIDYIVMAVALIIVIVYAIERIRQNSNLDKIFNDIISDKTTIKRINENNKIVECKLKENDFTLKFNLSEKKYIFIAITLTADFLNIIHFAIMGKLRQLQKYNTHPIIYLTVINKNEEKREKIKTIFEKILRLYLRKPEIILNEHKLDDETMNKLDETTIQEVLDLFPLHKKQLNTSNYLISIMMPFIENSIQQKKQALVICGADMEGFWEWDKINRKKTPLLFILPTLKGLDGNDINPKSEQNTLVVRFNFDNPKPSIASIDSVISSVENATNREALLQIYIFFVFPLREIYYPAKNNILFTVNKNDGSKCDIKNITDIIQKLENVPIEDLKKDLKDNQINILLNELSTYINKKIKYGKF